MYYEMFQKLCEMKGIKPGTVSRETGIATSTLTAWKQGKYTPKPNKLQKIADYFGVSLEYFMENETKKSTGAAYYFDPETAAIAQEVFDNPELRILFSAARDAKPENIQLAAEMLKRMKETNPDG